MADQTQDPAVYRVKDAFAVPAADGFPRTYAVGKLISGDDPLAASHRALLEPVANAVEKTTVILDVEQATAEPGRRRRGVRLPSGVDLKQATEPHTGSAHTEENQMVHTLPPEHPLSPASPFASEQPGLGVVADDVPKEQNKADAPTAAEVTAEAAEESAAQAATDAAEVKKAAAKASKNTSK